MNTGHPHESHHVTVDGHSRDDGPTAAVVIIEVSYTNPLQLQGLGFGMMDTGVGIRPPLISAC